MCTVRWGKVFLPAIKTTDTIEIESRKRDEIPRGKGELILVVDDEVSIREIARATLEANGYRVITASDGADALA